MIETLSSLLGLMKEHGANRFYAKKLAPNDNSKNQVYLGGDFSALNIIPHLSVRTDSDDKAGSKRDRAKAKVLLSWVDENGCYDAPNTQLILYPKYPEVRMSGFLRGCPEAPSCIMNVRDEGRVLFLGITNDGRVLGYAVASDHPLAKMLSARTGLVETGVFLEIPSDPDESSSRVQLIAKLREITRKRWISSQKLGPDGRPHPYAARNGGGYTLEAELGILPNGYSEPDYLGWEIKQYGVRDFKNFQPKSPVTLMTPEPTGGLYKDEGVAAFLGQFGYGDKSGKPDRINFGGVYAIGRGFHKDTGLSLDLLGYDREIGKITDMDGGLALVSKDDEIAALWKFTGIMEHWNRKHAQAAYIPSMFCSSPPSYAYGARVLLCEQTDFSLFLKAVSAGLVYYDPAIKMEKASTDNPAIKRRSQFRVKHTNLAQLYREHEFVDVETATA